MEVVVLVNGPCDGWQVLVPEGSRCLKVLLGAGNEFYVRQHPGMERMEFQPHPH